MKNHTDLNLGVVVYISIICHIRFLFCMQTTYTGVRGPEGQGFFYPFLVRNSPEKSQILVIG